MCGSMCSVYGKHKPELSKLVCFITLSNRLNLDYTCKHMIVYSHSSLL